MFWGIIAAVVSGTLMSVQGVFNSEVTKQTSMWVSASYVQATALIVCIIGWFVTGREGSFIALTRVSPWYMLTGGAMGAFITYTVIVGMQNLGPAKAVMFIVTMQLIVAYLIELFGLFGVEKVSFEWKKLVATLIIITGIIMFKWEK